MKTVSFISGNDHILNDKPQNEGQSNPVFSLAPLTLNVDTRGVISDLTSMWDDEVLAFWYVLMSLFGTVYCVVGGGGES